MLIKVIIQRKQHYQQEDDQQLKHGIVFQYFRIMVLSCFWLIYLCHLSSCLVMKAVYRATALVFFNILMYTWLEQVTETQPSQHTWHCSSKFPDEHKAQLY